MLYSSNKRRVLTAARPFSHRETESIQTFADKHRSLPVSIVALFIGCMMLFAFSVFVMVQVFAQINAAEVVNAVETVAKYVPAGTGSVIAEALRS